MDKDKLIKLTNAWLNGTATEEEKQLLHNWYDAVEDKEEVVITAVAETEEQVGQRILANLKSKIEFKKTKIVPLFRHTWFRVAAASLFIMLSVSTYLFVKNTSEPTIVKAGSDNLIHDVAAPATTKATITLADGSMVTLDSMNAGTLATQGNITVTKNANGQISYNASQLKANSSQLVFNTLSNPRGSKIVDITLSDGSHIWLNAGSSLTYPVAFTGSERKVSITGEAYFEVTHNASKPFYVNKGDMEVKVLGTHFNINAYDDEPGIKVTLLKGSVKVTLAPNGQPTTRNGKRETVLFPGHAASIHNSSLIIHNSVDLNEIMSWKDNRFYFMSADIKTIARQLSRWYDVDIEIAGNINDHFTGIISRNVNASEVFGMLQKTGTMKVNIEGKKVMISN